jgi:hypothetical protein
VTNSPKSTEVDEALYRTRRWYEQTKNPLYVWEAITWCLNSGDERPLPDWCLEYLRNIAANLCRLSCGVDFRERSKRISPDAASKLVAGALFLSRQGKRNAFKSLANDLDDMRSELDEVYYGPETSTSRIERLRGVTRKSARRRALRGKRLLGVKPKTST